MACVNEDCHVEREIAMKMKDEGPRLHFGESIIGCLYKNAMEQ